MDNHIKVSKALRVLAPKAQYTISEGVIIAWDSKDIKQPTKKQIEAKVKELEAGFIIEAKGQAIENHIYKNYSQKKQTQDEKWVSSYTTKLKAGGVDNLEAQVVKMIGFFFTGKSLSECLESVTVQEQKPYFEKLVKVGIRTEWAERCIQEGTTAIAENREPDYLEFPKGL